MRVISPKEGQKMTNNWTINLELKFIYFPPEEKKTGFSLSLKPYTLPSLASDLPDSRPVILCLFDA
jgi:hypothetical protein